MHKKVLTGMISVAMIAILMGCGSTAVSATQELTAASEDSGTEVTAEAGETATADTGSTESTESADMANTSGNMGSMGGMGGPGGNMGAGMTIDKSADTELQDMIAGVKDKFTQGSYSDDETGLTVPYNIYLPEGYDKSKSYPLVVFIGDATTVGTDMEYPLTQGWGGLIWATDEWQQDNQCIVLVPVYPETVIDDNNGNKNISDYVDLTERMINEVSSEYAVDTDRIYGTGQSMGAMTTMYLAANYPDLYAAVLIVDGQWDVADLKGLENQNIIYVAAGGDEKASAGQQNVEAMLDADGVSYSKVTDLDAQVDRETLNKEIQAMLDKGSNINFVTWTAGTVMEGVSSNISSEHMASFDYGYKLSSVRDWIFAQKK